MPAQPITLSQRVLAIDPALRCTGYAVLERGLRGRFRVLAHGTIKNHDKLLQSGCLVAIRERVKELFAEHKPDSGAIEAVIFVQSVKTAMTMGCARGAAILAMAEHGLPVYEYAPRRVKQAVVGRGGAQKDQVNFMVRALADGLTETPSPDAADALAIGITHFQTEDSAIRGASELKRI